MSEDDALEIKPPSNTDSEEAIKRLKENQKRNSSRNLFHRSLKTKSKLKLMGVKDKNVQISMTLSKSSRIENHMYKSRQMSKLTKIELKQSKSRKNANKKWARQTIDVLVMSTRCTKSPIPQIKNSLNYASNNGEKKGRVKRWKKRAGQTKMKNHQINQRK